MNDEFPVVIRWSRVGNQAQVGELDISGTIDLVGLEDLIKEQVSRHLQGDFDVRLNVIVELDGGVWRDMPFGYGRIQHELPKAIPNA